MGRRGTSWAPSPWARRLGISGAWRLECHDEHLRIIQGKRQQSYPLWQLTDIAQTSRFVWRTCRLTFTPGRGEVADPDEHEQTVSLVGMTRGDASHLHTCLRQRVQQLVATELSSLLPALDGWQQDAGRAIEQPRWIRQSDLEDLTTRRDGLCGEKTGMPVRVAVDNPLVGDLTALPTPQAVRSTASDAFSDQWQQAAEQHNQEWTELELQRQQAFFDGVESHPLTEEQARAAVCFDDRVRLIAAAGSGKTSTMVARAGYAIRAGIARPEEVLLLAFNADAAQELRERVHTKLTPWVDGAENIEVATFHAFSLKIIGEATGRKPTVPAWLSSGQDLGAIVRIIHDLMQSDSDFRASVALFSVVLRQEVGPFKDLSQHGSRTSDPLMASDHERIVTLRGEVVKSQEEKVLADWLLLHGIEYAYERPYPIETADAEHGHYHPDFYYPDIDLYHEHLALDAQGNPPPHFENYAEGVEWKRKLHHQAGNRYVETTSHQLREGAAFDHLKATLEHYGLTPTPSLENLAGIAEPMPVPDLAKLLRTFMQHFKTNGHTLESVEKRARKSLVVPIRVRLFLRIFETVLRAWDQRLVDEGAVDFDDMLRLAAERVEDGSWTSPYRVIAVDEWQDTSAARARLAKALNHRDTSLFVVGDDSQGIYTFAGADIRYMTEFDQRVGKGTTLFLSETFRCPQSLYDMATEFVMANPAQIPKAVHSHNPLEGRSVRVVPHAKGDLETALLQELQRLSAHAHAQGAAYTILLLGRYRYDCPDMLRDWHAWFSSQLEIRFSTVHQAKGLEADYVFLVNVHQGTSGFPAQKEDDTLITLVMPEADPYPHAEERRLFYVALTRAKRRVLLFAEESRVSRFISELEDYGLPPLKTTDGQPLRRCSKCGDGVMVQRQSNKGGFWGCSRFPACRHTQPVSPPASARF